MLAVDQGSYIVFLTIFALFAKTARGRLRWPEGTARYGSGLRLVGSRTATLACNCQALERKRTAVALDEGSYIAFITNFARFAETVHTA